MGRFVQNIAIASLAVLAFASAALACGAGQTTMSKPITTTAQTDAPPMTPMPAPTPQTGG